MSQPVKWRGTTDFAKQKLREQRRLAQPLTRALENDLVRQLEVHQDLRLNLDRLAVQVVGFVFPLLDGFLRSSSQNAFSADYLEIRDVSRLTDSGLQLYGPLDAHLHCLGGIPRLYALQQQTFHHALRHSDNL